MPPDSILAALRHIVGPSNVLTEEADMAPYLREWRGLFQGRALAVVRPGTTPEVGHMLRLCSEKGTPVVPQGGNTGLVGGQTPDESGRSLVLSLARLDRVREVDALGDTMVVEAGVTLLHAQEAAEQAGRLFPLSLASEGSCTIGGNLATNAGGTAVLAYGNARDLVLGLEVVLADGRIWNGLGRLRKDNTGYDLRNLFIGSEGTLGVITAAALKLFPRPRSVATAFAALPSPAAALEFLALCRARLPGTVTTFELLPRLALDLVLAHIPGTRDPLGQPHPWYVLLEVSSTGEADLQTAAGDVLAVALETGLIRDAAVATSLDQRNALWRIRESVPEAQTREGGSIKHDIALPVHCLPQFIAETVPALLDMVPGSRPLPYGHLGDGNLHFNLVQPVHADTTAFLARWDAVSEVVHQRVLALGGSVSAEHGIGQLKRDLLARTKDPVALDLMRSLKATLDPKGILNPGKVL